MKKLNILIATAIASPIAIVPFVTSCSCSYENEINTLMNNINSKFGKNPEQLSQTSVIDEAAAKKEYATLFNSDDNKKNEILFDCFNFVAKKDLTIKALDQASQETSVKVTPDNKSFYDLYKDGTIQVNMGYNININEIVNNQYFDFTMTGFVLCAYAKDIGDFKYNDFVQFVYELSATIRLDFVALEDAQQTKYDMGVAYSFSSSNDPTQSFGFIQMRKGGKNYPAISINNMTDANFDEGRCYYRGYYTKTQS